MILAQNILFSKSKNTVSLILIHMGPPQILLTILFLIYYKNTMLLSQCAQNDEFIVLSCWTIFTVFASVDEVLIEFSPCKAYVISRDGPNFGPGPGMAEVRPIFINPA